MLQILMYCVGLIPEPGWDAGGKRLETVMVSKVTEGGVADQCGVWEGDEVMRVNGRAARDTWGTLEKIDSGYYNEVYVRFIR